MRKVTAMGVKAGVGELGTDMYTHPEMVIAT